MKEGVCVGGLLVWGRTSVAVGGGEGERGGGGLSSQRQLGKRDSS